MTSPLSLLTTKGARTESRLPSAFSRACNPTQAHLGPQPPRPTWKTGRSARRKLNDSELSGLITALQGPAAGAVEAKIKRAVTAAQRGGPKPALGTFVDMGISRMESWEGPDRHSQ